MKFSFEDFEIFTDVVICNHLPPYVKNAFMAKMSYEEKKSIKTKMDDVASKADDDERLTAFLQAKEAELGYVERVFPLLKKLAKFYPVEGRGFEQKHIDMLREIDCPKLAGIYKESLALAAAKPVTPIKIVSRASYAKRDR